jgi:hypothetical protein
MIKKMTTLSLKTTRIGKREKVSDKQLIKFEMIKDCKESLYCFAKNVLGYRDINEKTHGEIIDALENSTTRKLICVPRGCLKSSLACVAYPLYLLINNPSLRILIDSELYTNSATFLREIKSHTQTPFFQSLFGDWRTKVWNESEIIISKRKKTLKEASITVGGIGTTKVGQHFDVIIGDDYNSPSNTNTIENAKKVVDHFKYNLSILEPDGTYVVIGTRYSSNDLIGHILSTEEHDCAVAS